MFRHIFDRHLKVDDAVCLFTNAQHMEEYMHANK